MRRIRSVTTRDRAHFHVDMHVRGSMILNGCGVPFKRGDRLLSQPDISDLRDGPGNLFGHLTKAIIGQQWKSKPLQRSPLEWLLLLSNWETIVGLRPAIVNFDDPYAGPVV